jgi:hypothetical protein
MESPYQQFTGDKIDAGLHLKAGFGEYGQATVATTDNTMKERTSSVIVLGPTENKTGSYRVLCLTEWKVLVRHDIKLLPTPENVVKFMNNRAQQDFSSKRLKKDRMIDDEDLNEETQEEIEEQGVSIDARNYMKKNVGNSYNGYEPNVDIPQTRKSARLAAAASAGQKTAGQDLSKYGRYGVLMEEEDNDTTGIEDEYEGYWTESMLKQDLENESEKIREIYGLKPKEDALVAQRKGVTNDRRGRKGDKERGWTDARKESMAPSTHGIVDRRRKESYNQIVTILKRKI